MWQEIVILFTEMGWVVSLLLGFGLAFLIVEAAIPGFGFFGISGCVMLIVGIILRVSNSGRGNPVAQFFLLLLMVAIILAIAFFFVALSAKKGWLSRTAIFKTGIAIPEGHTDAHEDFSTLLTKEGESVTELHPVGKAEIDGRLYDVSAESGFIEKGTKVFVVSVEGIRITVRKV